MTKAATVTEAQISRAIRAAQKNGLRVKAINPSDGTIIVDTNETVISIERAEKTVEDIYADR
jgi:pyrimidine deaminase RibD-like protein